MNRSLPFKFRFFLLSCTPFKFRIFEWDNQFKDLPHTSNLLWGLRNRIRDLYFGLKFFLLHDDEIYFIADFGHAICWL